MEAIFNRHVKDFRENFTIEFDVKFPSTKNEVSEEDLYYEFETGTFTNHWAQKCFEQIEKVCKSKQWRPMDWSFAGRSNGWFVLLCIGDYTKVTQRQIGKIEQIVEYYFINYNIELSKYYNEVKIK
jgi:hypothetical protein